MRVEKYDDAIVIKSTYEFWLSAVAGVVMSLLGMYLFFKFADEKANFIDYLTLFVFVISGLLIFLYSLNNALSKIIIYENGVYYKSLFTKRAYAWSEIRDYGLSRSGHSKFGNGVYEFYFSNKVQVKKDNRSKKLRGKIIKLTIMDNEYSYISKTVIPFCRKNIKSAPFIPDELFSYR